MSSSGQSVKDLISLQILKLQDNGWLDDLESIWWDKNSPIARHCRQSESKKRHEFTLTQFMGVYMILITGASFAILISINTFIYNKISQFIQFGIRKEKIFSCEFFKNRYKARRIIRTRQVYDTAKKIQKTTLLHRRKDNDLWKRKKVLLNKFRIVIEILERLPDIVVKNAFMNTRKSCTEFDRLFPF